MPTAKNFGSTAKKVWILNIDPASINAGVTSVQTFTCKGARKTMFTITQVDSYEFADVRIVSSRVSADDTVELVFSNFGASTRNMAAFDVKVMGL